MSRALVVVVALAFALLGCSSDGEHRAKPVVTTTCTTEPYRSPELHGADVAIRLYKLTEDTDGYALEEWLSSPPARALFGGRIIAVRHEDATESLYVYLSDPLSRAERLAVYASLHGHPAVVRLDFYAPASEPPRSSTSQSQ